MNKIIVIALLFIACTPSTISLSENTLLKDLPATFFTKATAHTIKNDTTNYSFTNTYKRFPNSEFSKFYLKKHPENYHNFFNVTLNLNADTTITLEGEIVLKNELIPFTKEYIDFAAEGKPTMIHLNFDEHNSLKSYIDFVNFTKQLVSKNISFNPNVFVYNKELLPDCNCSL